MTGFKSVATLPRKHPSIGCCGIDCGLCPRYYTGGSSRCPGCGGEGFEQKHPPCGFISCCVKKHGVEVCAGCGEFPCAKFDKETGERDSFVTHRRVMANQKRIAEVGLERFLEEQRRRVVFLETALSQYDDGKSKNFFCLAAALLSIDGLNKALEAAKNGAALRIASAECAAAEEEELKLRK
jgi:hypothetical protein